GAGDRGTPCTATPDRRRSTALRRRVRHRGGEPMSGSIGRRYAKAIIAVAQEQHSLEQTGDELRLLRALAADPEIAQGLSNPLLSATARRGLARAVAEQLKLRPIMRNFLSLLADHRRLDQLVSIADQYEKILDQMLGRVRATITSA